MMIPELIRRLYSWTPPQLTVARSQLGVGENPPGSNKTPYGDWLDSGPWADMCHTPYTYNGDKWCAQFITWCYGQSGILLPSWQHKQYPGAASVAIMWDGFADEGWIVHEPKAGDLSFYKGHVDMIERRDGDYVATIGGNTTIPGKSGAYYVWRKTRHIDECLAFGRVK